MGFPQCYLNIPTLRVEDRQKKNWIDTKNWQYINNDRFIIPNEVKEVSIQIKKKLYNSVRVSRKAYSVKVYTLGTAKCSVNTLVRQSVDMDKYN